jgi:hypothetical protein
VKTEKVRRKSPIFKVVARLMCCQKYIYRFVLSAFLLKIFTIEVDSSMKKGDPKMGFCPLAPKPWGLGG